MKFKRTAQRLIFYRKKNTNQGCLFFLRQKIYATPRFFLQTELAILQLREGAIAQTPKVNRFAC